MEGKIDTINSEKGFAFIAGDDNKRYFFHKTDFSGYWADLVDDYRMGQNIKMKFIAGQTEKGLRASDVSRLDFPNQAV